MPNKRKDTKRHLGLWLEPEEVEALKARAKAENATVADIIRAAVLKYEQSKKNVVGPTGSRGNGDDSESRKG
jgi:NRPS condensation-like uncharacterized protein